jgi:hypothetical protein
MVMFENAGLCVLVLVLLPGCEDSAESDGDDSGTGGSGSVSTSTAAEREKLSCAELEVKLEEDSRAFDFPVEVTLGSWEGVPEALTVLPPGAELCGSVDTLNQGLIISELDGPALESYYRPLFEELGCAPLECDTETRGSEQQLVCTCLGEENFGTLTTAPDVAYYLIAYQ